MNQKPDNFSKKYRRSRMVEGHTATIRRPTLFSVQNSDQLAEECSRVRLIQQLTKPDNTPPKDFTAYFQSSAKNCDPACVVTSHHVGYGQLPRRRLIIPTYPCTQSIRWNPYVETSSIDEDPVIPEQKFDLRPSLRHNPYNLRPDMRPDMRFEPRPSLRPEEPKFNCRCESCAMKKCPSRVSPSNATRPVFRDNIMTFCDRDTMTPKVNEVACGCTPVPSTRVSDVSVTASDIAVKDTQASMELHQLYCPENCPASILKRNPPQEDYPSYSRSHCCEHAYHPPVNFQQEPERDVIEECIEPSRISSIKSFFRCKKKKNCAVNPRRIIYNEGISDMISNRYPVTPIKVPSPTNLRNECSQASFRSNLNEGIPFSHRSDSRYHYNCKKSNSRSFYGDSDEVRHVIASPEIIRKSYANKPMKYHKLPSIRMPKRVLTSERDIEAYIDRGYPKVLVPATRRPRGN